MGDKHKQDLITVESLNAPDLVRKGKSTSDNIQIKKKTHKVEPIRPILRKNYDTKNDVSLELDFLTTNQRHRRTEVGSRSDLIRKELSPLPHN